MTRELLIQETKKWWEEAFTSDSVRTMENTLAVLGIEVFVWSNLTVRQLRALRLAILPTVLEARG